MRKHTTVAFTSLIVALAFTLFTPPAQASADAGDCGNRTDRRFSLACIKQGMQAGPWGGIYTQWNSAALNIDDIAPEFGGFFLHGLWLTNEWNVPGTASWLEVGEVAGWDGRQERHRYWVDGSAGGAGIEHSVMAFAPADNVYRNWEIQWLGGGSQEGWAVYINDAQVGGSGENRQPIPWIQPSQMTNYLGAVGFEVVTAAFDLRLDGNSRTNTRNPSNLTETFDSRPLQLRDQFCSPFCVWRYWSANQSQVDGPQPCDPVSPPYPCFNGVNGPDGPRNWKANKPK